MNLKKFSAIYQLLIIFLFFSFFCHSHFIKKLNFPLTKISAFTNQSKQYQIPFQKCFKIKPQIQSNKQLYQFKPTSLNLKKQISYQILENHNFTLLDSLRSSLTFKHKAMTILDDNLIMLYSMPNKIIIIKQEEKIQEINGQKVKKNYFKVLDQYRIQQMKSLSTHFKLYKFSKNRSIMIIQNHKSFYLLDDKGYQYFSLPIDITLAHLELLEGNDILIAQFNRGLGHYKLNAQKQQVQFVARYKSKDLGIQENYIVDVNTQYVPQGEIYLLDAKAGLIKLKYDKITKKISDPQIIVAQNNCQAFDTASNDYFVLLCQVQGYSSIIEIYKKQQNGKIIYERLQPIFYNSFFTDIEVSNKFYMIFSNKLINVFWNTKKNKLPQTLETQSQISIPGLQTFKLKKIIENNVEKVYLYAVESGKLVKYSLQQSKPKLSFLSKDPLYKNITISLFGSCSLINENLKSQISTTQQRQYKISELTNQNNIITCEIRQPILLNIQPEIYSNDGDYQISASIIILLILIFLVIIWICLKKYKGLEKQARKVLQVYKKKKNSNKSRAI